MVKKLFCIVLLIGFIASCNIGESATEKINTATSITILIDHTDGITKEQQARLIHEISILKDSLKENDQLTIYEVSGSYEKIAEQYTPLYSTTIPANPNECNEITTTCKKVQKRYDTFEQTFSDTLTNISFDTSYDNSYILESLQMIVTTKQFQSFQNKKFIIFSNMLQNSKAVSHYRNYDTIENLQKELHIFNVKGTLINTKVDINMLPDNKRLQDEKLREWWGDYFKITNANTVNILIF